MELALLKLILAHLLGDFFFQPHAWVVEKEAKRLRSDKLYLHVAIHTALIFLVFFDLGVWKLALTVGLLHFIIDAAKLSFQTKKYGKLWFFADQLLHVGTLFACWMVYWGISANIGFLHERKFWFVITGVVFLALPASIIINKILPKNSSAPTQSLENAGKYIGIIERLLVLTFIMANQFEAVGFLIAAKSIFRFGDLKEAHDIRLTEYVLIGTLLSFGLAVTTSLLIKHTI